MFTIDYWKGDSKRTARFEDSALMEEFARLVQRQGAKDVTMYTLVPMGTFPTPATEEDARMMIAVGVQFLEDKGLEI